MPKVKKTKNQLRREKQKLKKEQGTEEPQTASTDSNIIVKNERLSEPLKSSLLDDDLAIIGSNGSSVSVDSTGSTGKLFESEMDRMMANPEFQQFKLVFDKFQTNINSVEEESKDKGSLIESDDELGVENENEAEIEFVNNENSHPKHERKASKRKLKKMNKIPLAELKSMAKRPEIVQWYDADAEDPLMNLGLKENKNSVPVPHHWQFKREYLVSRRGIERPQFQLPQYILDTGILSMRDTTKEDDKTLKQKSREKVQPKMNRLDLDYKKLYDAFFKFQTKPRLYGYGDLFYEGKGTGTETYKVAKYGEPISDELKDALGLGITFEGDYPWISKMKTHGPPPSYPWIKIINGNVANNDDNDQENEEDETPFVAFGKLLSFESDHEEESLEEKEEEPEYEEDSDEDNQPVVVDTEASHVILNDNKDSLLRLIDSVQAQESVKIEEQDKENDEEDVPLAVVAKQESKDTEPKALYQILKKKFVGENDGVLNTGVTYELPSANSGVSKRKAEDLFSKDEAKRHKSEETSVKEEGSNEDEDDEDEEDAKFKF